MNILNYKFITFLVLGLFVFPPIKANTVLGCVSDGSTNTSIDLIWTLPTLCDASDEIILYVSTDFAATNYNEIARFNINQNIEDYTYTFPASERVLNHYFYIETKQSCGISQTTVRSDTLSNGRPDEPIFESINTLANGNVELKWSPSPSPGVIEYEIRRNPIVNGEIDNNRTVVVGTVDQSVSSIIDTELNHITDDTKYIYNIKSNDCNKNGGFTSPSASPFLITAEADANNSACSASFALSWNDFEGYMNGVDKYEIETSNDENGPFTRAGSTTNTTIDLPNPQPFARVVAISNDGFESTSNVVVLPSNFQEGILLDLRVNAWTRRGTLLRILSYSYTQDADVSSLQLLSGTSPDNLSVIQDIDVSNGITDFELGLTVPEETDAPVFYQLLGKDNCENEVKSNIFSPIHLSGTSTVTERDISWNDVASDSFSITSFDVYKVVDGDTMLHEQNISGNTYSETVLESELGKEVCFFIVATVDYITLTGGQNSTVTQSNAFCTTSESDFFFPTGFVRNGVSSTFKPAFVSSAGAKYKLSIFNRYGQLLFQSELPEVGWNGTFDGKIAPLGTYTYVCEYEKGGQPTVLNGSFLMIQ